MFISLSKTLTRFGGFRLGVGIRMNKSNAVWMLLLVACVETFKAVWYMMIIALWLCYAMCYGIIWLCCKLFKTSVPFSKKLYDKVEQKKEGNQA